MINNVTLVGRLTKDIEKKITPSNLSTCTFTLACGRQFTDKDGNKKADFIQCVAWRQSADYLNMYAHKGSIVALTGSIQTRIYDGKNGRVYVTEVVADRVTLINSRNKNDANDNEEQANEDPVPEVTYDDLPFDE